MSEKVPPVYIDPERIVYGEMERWGYDKEEGWRITPIRSMLHIHREVLKNTIFLFFWCSQTGQWDEFPFQEVFTEIEKYFYWRLKHFFDDEKVKRLKETFDQSLYDDFFERSPFKMKDILDILFDIEHADTLRKQIRVFDKTIHLQHDRGNFFFNEEHYIDELRDEYESRYGRYV